jgi:hypothetical protein
VYLHELYLCEGRIGHHVLSLSRQCSMYMYVWEAKGGEMSHTDLTTYIPAGFTLTITSIYIFLPVHILSLCVYLITGCLVSIKREKKGTKRQCVRDLYIGEKRSEYVFVFKNETPILLFFSFLL